MKDNVYPSLASYVRAFADHFLDKCTSCGNCIDVCPIYPHSEFRDSDPIQVREKLNAFLESRAYAEEVGAFLDVCIRCGMCSIVCPVDLDNLHLNDLIKPWAKESGNLSGSAFIPFLPDTEYNFMKVLAAIQIKPSEKRWLTEIPVDPPKADVVFYTSCGGVAFPDRLFAQIDILERTGVNFVTMGAFECNACCGSVNMVGAGSHEMAEKRARDLIVKLERFSPETVITSCPHCIVWIREHVKYFRPYSFKIQDYYAFISEHLASIDFKPVDLTVTVHDHCTLARPVDKSGHLRQILKAITGVKIIEMNRIGSNSPCCGENLPHQLNWLGQEMRQERLNEASTTGAKELLTACPACDHNFSIEAVEYPIAVRNIMHLLTESIGIEQYENKLEHFRSYHNIDRVLEETEDTIRENGYTPEELREPLSYYLWGMRG